MSTKEKEFFRPSVTADIVVLRESRSMMGRWELLLIRRSQNAKTFPGALALPGGFMDHSDDDIYECAARELKEETGITAQKLELVTTATEKGRDPRGPVHSTVFICKVPADTEARAGDDAAEAIWFELDKTTISRDLVCLTFYNRVHNLFLTVNYRAEEGRFGRKKYVAHVKPQDVAFDHARIIAEVIDGRIFNAGR